MKGTHFSADTKAITSCRSAENDRATSCFSWPLTTSPKDMVFLVSPSLFSLPKTLAPYSWISNGGCESCEDRLYFQIHHKNGIKFEMNYTRSAQTCSSKFCSILCFHVETRAANSVCLSVSARLARRESYIQKTWF